MSMTKCDHCGRVVDTDEEPEGYYDWNDKPWPNDEYICMYCQDRMYADEEMAKDKERETK